MYVDPNLPIHPILPSLSVSTCLFSTSESIPALEIDLWFLNNVVRRGLIEKVSWTSWERVAVPVFGGRGQLQGAMEEWGEKEEWQVLVWGHGCRHHEGLGGHWEDWLHSAPM